MFILIVVFVVAIGLYINYTNTTLIYKSYNNYNVYITVYRIRDMSQITYEIQKKMEERRIKYSSMSKSIDNIWCIRTDSDEDAHNVARIIKQTGLRHFVDRALNFVYFVE